MSNWEETSLGDLIDIKHGFAFKGQYFSDTPPGNVLLTPGNFAIGGGFQFNKLKYYDGPNEPDYTLQGGELLVTMTDLSKAGDTLGYPAIVPADARTFLHNQRLGKVVVKSDAVDQDFIYWLMRTPAYRNEVLSSYTGSTVKHTSPTRIQAFRFMMPPRDEQEVIVACLSALDDKIELNRRMNETLEEMARALFRDWFVDFGPTRRQMEGATDPAAIMGQAFPARDMPAELGTGSASGTSTTKPLSAATLAPLFPARLGDDGLPEGWERQKIENALDRLKVGKLYNQKTALNVGKVPILDQGKFGVIGYHNNEPNIVASAENRVGIFANHTCVQRLLDHPFSTIQNVIPFRGKELPTEWCHYATLGRQAFEEYKGHWPTFVSKEIIKPKPEPAIAFSEFVDAILLHVSANEQENQTLAALRDLLLPKLMSGEIRLKDAEAME